ncbi:hypothetical protein KCU88_g17, partial [Aureobasidium melanogenum]
MRLPTSPVAPKTSSFLHAEEEYGKPTIEKPDKAELCNTHLGAPVDQRSRLSGARLSTAARKGGALCYLPSTGDSNPNSERNAAGISGDPSLEQTWIYYYTLSRRFQARWTESRFQLVKKGSMIKRPTTVASSLPRNAKRDVQCLASGQLATHSKASWPDEASYTFVYSRLTRGKESPHEQQQSLLLSRIITNIEKLNEAVAMMNRNLQVWSDRGSNMNVELVAQMFKNYQSNVLFHLEGV